MSAINGISKQHPSRYYNYCAFMAIWGMITSLFGHGHTQPPLGGWEILSGLNGHTGRLVYLRRGKPVANGSVQNMVAKSSTSSKVC